MICTLPRGEGGEREGYTTINTLFNITNIKTRFHINARGTMAVISFATSQYHTHTYCLSYYNTNTYTHTTNPHVTFIVQGARAVISFSMRSGRPLYIVVPDFLFFIIITLLLPCGLEGPCTWWFLIISMQYRV